MSTIRTCDLCDKSYPEKTGGELQTKHWHKGNERRDTLYLCGDCYKKHVNWWNKQVKEHDSDK